MLTVDLVYESGCPNISAARANLLRAFARAQVAARWIEHRIGDPEAPGRTRGYGSPTVLVNGRDVIEVPSAGGEQHGELRYEAASTSETSCRIYREGDAYAGAPPVDAIVVALRAASRDGGPAPTGRWRSSLAVLPGLFVALLPKMACPLCWPLYAGVLSAAGLGFLMKDRWLLAVSATLLLVAVSALFWRARTRRGYLPAGAGTVAAALILTGKFVWDSEVVVYGGIGVLLAASAINAWPRRAKGGVHPCCAPTAATSDGITGQSWTEAEPTEQEARG